MSLHGNLEDVRAVDAIQFIYIGARSGTLRIDTPGGRRAALGFHDGLIANAWVSGTPRLGELLVAAGLLSAAALKAAQAAQRKEARPRPIGKMFISQGLVTEARIKQHLAEHFSRIVFEIATWTSGTFLFLPEDGWPIEGLSSSADDQAGRVELDMAGLLRDLAHRAERPSVSLFDDKTVVDAVPAGQTETLPGRG